MVGVKFGGVFLFYISFVYVEGVLFLFHISFLDVGGVLI